MASNKYKYKVQESDFSALPELGDDLSAWTDWNGTDEITATNGYYIAVAETEANNTCERVGKRQVSSRVQSTITYMDGESEITGLTPTTYLEGIGATLPTEVTKQDYTFDGWYNNAGLTGDVVTEIGTSATGNKTFYAKFTGVAPQGEVYTDGGTTLTITTDESTGTKSFTWQETGEETITGTAKDSVPQTQGVDTAYFLDTGEKYYLVEITGDTTECTMVFDNASIYNRARFGTGQGATYAYIPLEPEDDGSGYTLEITEQVDHANQYTIMFDASAPILTDIALTAIGPTTIDLGDYGYTNTMHYSGNNQSFNTQVTISAIPIRYISVTTTDATMHDFGYMIWGASKYTLDQTNSTFTVENSTIHDVNKLSGTFTTSQDQQTGAYLMDFEYLDQTHDVFSMTIGEDGVADIEHVEQGE